jgi:hypothetical protein
MIRRPGVSECYSVKTGTSSPRIRSSPGVDRCRHRLKERFGIRFDGAVVCLRYTGQHVQSLYHVWERNAGNETFSAYMEAYIAVQVRCPTAQPRPRRSRAK